MSEDLRQKALKLEVAKKYGEAAAIYKQMRLFDKAAYMCQKAGLSEEAIRLYAEAKLFAKAAELCERLEQWSRAAKMWEKAGQSSEAVKARLRAGEAHLAGRAQAATAEPSEARTGRQRPVAELQEAAVALEKAGEYGRAAALHVEAGEPMSALHVCARGHDAAGAAQIYLVHLKDRAYEIIHDIPKEGNLYKNYAAVFIMAAEFPMAAHVWENFGEFIKAGELYERIKDDMSAAESFLKGQDIERAAMMYSRCGEHLRAAELFLRAGNHDWAAECFEKAGRHFEAGQHYAEAENFEKAIERLQFIEDGHEDYFAASVLLCRAYRAKGFSDLALERYKKVLASTPLTRDTLDFYYDLAVLYRAKRAYSQAADVLRQIVGLQFGYKDAANLLQEVSGMSELSKTASAKILRPDVAAKKPKLAPPAPSGEATAHHAEKPPPPPPAPPKPKDPFASWLTTLKKEKE